MCEVSSPFIVQLQTRVFIVLCCLFELQYVCKMSQEESVMYRLTDNIVEWFVSCKHNIMVVQLTHDSSKFLQSTDSFVELHGET